ncbi:MAG: orotate phosphoribosyltransferase [Acidobacteria bacterium]|nr:orotate phosphoribosyltransferase [Acidobacteriota bacterium]
MATPRAELLTKLAEKSFELGTFTLSSGAISDYYVDCRTTTLDAEGARLTGRLFLDEIHIRGWNPAAIGGLTLGADPIVVAVAILSAQQLQRRGSERAPTPDVAEGVIEGFLVRKQEKSHGTGQRIEGFRRKGAPVIIVDDVCTTGASTMEAFHVAREFGFEVIAVMCLVEREEAGGRAAIEKVVAPAAFVAIFKATEVREEYLRQRAMRASL